MRISLPIVLVVACHASPQAPVPPPLQAASGPPCALRVEAAAPSASGPRAKLAVKWRGEGTGNASPNVCITVGDKVERVPRGEQRIVEVRADTSALQRIVVDGRAHLMHVAPDAAITLGDNPCFFYELSGPSTDAWFVAPPHAYCAAPGKACKAGYEHASSPRPVHDDLCGDTATEIRRCVKMGEVRLDRSRPLPGPIATQSEDDEVIPLATLAAAPLHLMPRTCGFAMLDAGKEVVALAIGAGETWTLAVENGRVTGRIAR